MQKEVIIKKGMSLQSIALTLKRNRVIPNSSSFLLCSRLLGVSRKLQAGNYRFSSNLSNYSVLKKLYKGEVLSKMIMIPEGLRADQIAGILKKKIDIDSTKFMKLVSDVDLCDSLGIEANSFEGYLYPNTYRFFKQISSKEALIYLVSHFKNIFADSLKERANQISMSVHETITLASIVEGEAMVGFERPVIAALYLNRLKKGMRLQADPTIQYVIENGPRRLLIRDLDVESPYNTYLHRGLPPGPVNNPGISSIIAVLYPADVDYLYMVANGDSTHTFSRTLNDHLRAKNRFNRYRRTLNRNR